MAQEVHRGRSFGSTPQEVSEMLSLLGQSEASDPDDKELMHLLETIKDMIEDEPESPAGSLVRDRGKTSASLGGPIKQNINIMGTGDKADQHRGGGNLHGEPGAPPPPDTVTQEELPPPSPGCRSIATTTCHHRPVVVQRSPTQPSPSSSGKKAMRNAGVCHQLTAT